MNVKRKNLFDLIIIGGGPGGSIASIYAARKRLKTLIITKSFGGQSISTDYIENWLGEISIKGSDLAKKIKNNVKHYESDIFSILEYHNVVNIQVINDNKKKIFSVKDNSGKIFFSKTILISTGAERRKLEVKGADKFEHKGLTYCASCDGPFFAEKDVVIVGGGNSGFEAASQLMSYARSVTILQRRNRFIAEPSMVENILKNKKVKGILSAKITEVFGTNFVEGVKYKDENEKEHTIKVDGVFVEIGAIPVTDFVSDEIVKKDEFKQIIINHKTGETSQSGIWAAGDCTDSIYKQNSVAMGDATKAIENLYKYIIQLD